MQDTQGPDTRCLADKPLSGFRALRSKGDLTLFLYLAWILEVDRAEVVIMRAGLAQASCQGYDLEINFTEISQLED